MAIKLQIPKESEFIEYQRTFQAIDSDIIDPNRTRIGKVIPYGPTIPLYNIGCKGKPVYLYFEKKNNRLNLKLKTQIRTLSFDKNLTLRNGFGLETRILQQMPHLNEPLLISKEYHLRLIYLNGFKEKENSLVARIYDICEDFQLETNTKELLSTIIQDLVKASKAEDKVLCYRGLHAARILKEFFGDLKEVPKNIRSLFCAPDL